MNLSPHNWEWASFFTEENGKKWEKKKGKEEPSTCESIRIIVDSSFLFCFVSKRLQRTQQNCPPLLLFCFCHLSRSFETVF